MSDEKRKPNKRSFRKRAERPKYAPLSGTLYRKGSGNTPDTDKVLPWRKCNWEIYEYIDTFNLSGVQYRILNKILRFWETEHKALEITQTKLADDVRCSLDAIKKNIPALVNNGLIYVGGTGAGKGATQYYWPNVDKILDGTIDYLKDLGIDCYCANGGENYTKRVEKNTPLRKYRKSRART